MGKTHKREKGQESNGSYTLFLKILLLTREKCDYVEVMDTNPQKKLRLNSSGNFTCSAPK